MYSIFATVYRLLLLAKLKICIASIIGYIALKVVITRPRPIGRNFSKSSIRKSDVAWTRRISAIVFNESSTTQEASRTFRVSRCETINAFPRPETSIYIFPQTSIEGNICFRTSLRSITELFKKACKQYMLIVASKYPVISDQSSKLIFSGKLKIQVIFFFISRKSDRGWRKRYLINITTPFRTIFQ